MWSTSTRSPSVFLQAAHFHFCARPRIQRVRYDGFFRHQLFGAVFEIAEGTSMERREIKQHSAIVMLVHDKTSSSGAPQIEVNRWLRVKQGVEEYASIFARRLPVFDKSGVPLGIVFRVDYVAPSVAKVLVVTRGTCLLYGADLTGMDAFGWRVTVLDDNYALDGKQSVEAQPTLQLVSIKSAPYKALRS